MNSLSFNLTTERWIPCVSSMRKSEPFNLEAVLRHAHEIQEIVHPSPLVTVAVHRLLLAILHRVYGPQNLEAWITLWRSGSWDSDKLGTYFGKWRHRFDLLNDDRPFFQVRGLEDAETHPVVLLAHELSSGNNQTLFDHRHDAFSKGMSPGEAACYLVAFQSYAIGFGKSQPFYFSDAPSVRGLTVLLTGHTLFETLALNLIGYNRNRPFPWQGEDLPAWEQDDPAKPDREGTTPCGYVDYLTWQARRIELLAQPSQRPPEILVTHCRVRQNLKLAEGTPPDPMEAYRRDDREGLLPVSANESRAVWRDCHALLEFRGDEFKRPEAFNWIARAKQEGAIPKRAGLTFSVLGLATAKGKAANVRLWRHERLPLPLGYLDDPDLIERLRLSLAVAKDVKAALWEGCRWFAQLALLRSDQKRTNKQQEAEIRQLVSSLDPAGRYWSRLEVPFRVFLETLPGSEGTDRDTESRHRDESRALESCRSQDRDCSIPRDCRKVRRLRPPSEGCRPGRSEVLP
jgi:CRISPR system Cascade subunit CasA